jgi:hypothetical protein
LACVILAIVCVEDGCGVRVNGDNVSGEACGVR